jgi:hypothetical protein
VSGAGAGAGAGVGAAGVGAGVGRGRGLGRGAGFGAGFGSAAVGRSGAAGALVRADGATTARDGWSTGGAETRAVGTAAVGLTAVGLTTWGAGSEARSAMITTLPGDSGMANAYRGEVASTPTVKLGSTIAPAIPVIASAPVSTRTKVGLMILPPLAEKLV